MATPLGPSAVKPMTASPSDTAQQMAILHNNILGCLYLGPKYMAKCVDLECRDKGPNETYKKYMERHDGSEFDQRKWRSMCSFNGPAFEVCTTPENMDVTALYSLLQNIYRIKLKDTGYSPKLSTLLNHWKKLKDLRNNLMHNATETLAATNFSMLTSVLPEMVRTAGEYYALKPDEVDELLQELDDEIKSEFSETKKEIARACFLLSSKGKEEVETRFLAFSEQVLLPSNVHVKLMDIFTFLDMARVEGNLEKSIPYKELFESGEKVIIVSGVTGAGKTTLLKTVALQYFNMINHETPTGLKDFEMLIYVECRNTEIKDFEQVIEHHFRVVCYEINIDKVIDALFHLKLLFLVDGFDEHNQNSKAVLTALFEKVWPRSNCRILITTRPHRVEELQHLLVVKNVTHAEYKLAPISDREKQIEFIRKYEKKFSGNNTQTITMSMSDCFSHLSLDVAAMLIEPISLLHFCSVFKHSPDIVTKWRTLHDVARDTLLLSKTIVKTKLCDKYVGDFNPLIDNIFLAIGEVALSYLQDGTLSFDGNVFQCQLKQCYAKLRDTKEFSDSKLMLILSSILKTQRSFFDTDETTYSFQHKSSQEYFAAHFVVKQLMRNIRLEEILPRDTAENQLQEVLLYVVQDLQSKSPETLTDSWSDFHAALRHAGLTNHEHWQAFMLRCPSVTNVARKAAELSFSHCKTWVISSDRTLNAVHLMISHKRPEKLNVKMLPMGLLNGLNGRRWDAVIKQYSGDLLLDLNSGINPYDPCDEVITRLEISRCKLVKFQGCVASSEAVRHVSSVSGSSTDMRLYLHSVAPDLGALQHKYQTLRVYTRPLASPAVPVPLPSPPAPSLTVEDPNSGHWTWEDVARTVVALAPLDKRYADLWLGKSLLKAAEEQRLLAALHECGVRTAQHGVTKCERKGFRATLHVTENAPVMEQP